MSEKGNHYHHQALLLAARLRDIGSRWIQLRNVIMAMSAIKIYTIGVRETQNTRKYKHNESILKPASTTMEDVDENHQPEGTKLDRNQSIASLITVNHQSFMKQWG
jgi:hypothetical protein